MKKLIRIKELMLAMEKAMIKHENLDTELESLIDRLTPKEIEMFESDETIIEITERINKLHNY